MPLELPGFYWDDAKQRYFPITARSAQPFGWQPSVTTTSSSPVGPIATSSSTTLPEKHHVEFEKNKKKRRRLETSLTTFARREQINHDIMTNSISCLSEGSVVYTGDFPISSFHISNVCEDGSLNIHTGDTGGWLSTCCIDPCGFAHNSSRELYLGSEVTAICHSSSLRVAASFGPSCKIALENTSLDSDMWTILNMSDKSAHDLRVADLQGSRLAIGAANKGIVVPNIEYSWQWDALNTGSDVLAICQKDYLVYTGTRNGSIKAFDCRINTQRKGQPLFGDRFTTDTRSITSLQVINECEMIVSTIRGDLELLDLRFTRSDTPVTSFYGHVNSYSTKLGITTSPCSSFLFAAGQDNRIRAWSLHSASRSPHPIGLSPLPDTNNSTDSVHPLQHTFKDPIVGLQVKGPESTSSPMTLWAAEGRNIWRFGLGHQIDSGRPNDI